MAKPPVYPSTVLTDALRACGADPRIMWEERGPKGTLIAFLSCYRIGKSLCIVQTFVDGGWEVFTPMMSNDLTATIADVLNRCGVPAPVTA